MPVPIISHNVGRIGTTDRSAISSSSTQSLHDEFETHLVACWKVVRLEIQQRRKSLLWLAFFICLREWVTSLPPQCRDISPYAALPLLLLLRSYLLVLSVTTMSEEASETVDRDVCSQPPDSRLILQCKRRPLTSADGSSVICTVCSSKLTWLATELETIKKQDEISWY